MIAGVHLRVAEGEGEVIGVENLGCSSEVESGIYRDCGCIKNCLQTFTYLLVEQIALGAVSAEDS